MDWLKVVLEKDRKNPTCTWFVALFGSTQGIAKTTTLVDDVCSTRLQLESCI
jgi:hypothetical protein